MSVVVTKIDQAGRLSISASHRRALGLDSGGPVVVAVVGKELRISSVHSTMSELQAEASRFLHENAASVDAFIAQRRSDLEHDELTESSPDRAAHPEDGKSAT